jgi:nucleoside-diphosphate-sugar epimerase
MRILLAGATGALGTAVARRLVAAGYDVLGLTRTYAGARVLTDLGVRPLVADVLDLPILLRAVGGERVDAVIQHLSTHARPLARHADLAAADRRLVEGTTNLVAAARAMGASRVLGQSVVLGYGYIDHGYHYLTEQSRYGHPAGAATDAHLAALLTAERLVLDAPHGEGLVLRYGLVYGEGVGGGASTGVGGGGSTSWLLRQLRSGRPVLPPHVGRYLPWIHVDDAAAATVAVLERGRAATAYNIVDEQPLSWGEMVTEVARRYGTPPPRPLPGWALRMTASYAAQLLLDTSMRVSSALAHREVGWWPRHRSVHEGLRAAAVDGS